MPLQIAIPQPNGSIAEHLLFEGRQYNIGRAEHADIVIAHPQVSRLHATLRATNDSEWSLDDTSSTGCFSAGKAISSHIINQPQELFLGPVSCRLTPLNLEKVVQLDSQRVWRKEQLKRYQNQLQGCDSSVALVHLARECLLHSLGCERASLLLFNDDPQNMQVNLGYEPWMDDANFTGSRTIIRQCVEHNQVLALGNLANEARFSQQQSVIRNNIQAAICVPVCVDNKPVGVLYADSIQSRQFFTQTDIEFAKSLANLLSLRLLFHAIELRLSLISN